jgi:hypothetical protein
VAVHGWIYRLRDGIIRDLGFTVKGENMIDDGYDVAVRNLAQRSSLG